MTCCYGDLARHFRSCRRAGHSSYASDFNFDFRVSFPGEELRYGAEYHFRRNDPTMNLGRAGKSESGPGRHAAMTGVGVADKWDC
jgi:predicted dithiol-disulfide oxidoreductase (DUF899 family)